MDYTLAKELKKAGFPNSEHWEDCKNLFRDNSSDYDDTILCTLSELIEACGVSKIDFVLRNFGTGDNNEWICGNYMPYEHDWIYYSTGSTPEEAVARLWLLINKK